MTDRLDAFLGQRIDLFPMQVLRRLAGVVVVLHLWPIVGGELYRDSFHEPYWRWYPELPPGVYLAVLWLGVLAGVAMALRVAARTATFVALAVVVYNLLLSTTHYRHNRAYLAIVLGCLALTPTRDAGPAWPVWLLRAEAVTVYGASGLSKLLDGDWWGGTVTHLRVAQVEDRLRESVLPGWFVDVVTDRSFHIGAAKVVVLTELFIAAGLLWRRTRYATVALAVVFHLIIEASASVQVFSWLAIVALVVWLPLRRPAQVGLCGDCGCPPTTITAQTGGDQENV